MFAIDIKISSAIKLAQWRSQAAIDNEIFCTTSKKVASHQYKKHCRDDATVLKAVLFYPYTGYKLQYKCGSCRDPEYSLGGLEDACGGHEVIV
jgi:hypothetical protein